MASVKHLVIAAVASPGLLCVCGCGPATYPASIAHPLLGQPLPAIHHRHTLDGQPVEAEQLAGKPVLVKFFAQYCQPCRATLPAAERLHESHPDVTFLGIDEDESAETADALAQQYGLKLRGRARRGQHPVGPLPREHDAHHLRGRFAGRRALGRGRGADRGDLRRAVEAAR